MKQPKKLKKQSLQCKMCKQLTLPRQLRRQFTHKQAQNKIQVYIPVVGMLY